MVLFLLKAAQLLIIGDTTSFEADSCLISNHISYPYFYKDKLQNQEGFKNLISIYKYHMVVIYKRHIMSCVYVKLSNTLFLLPTKTITSQRIPQFITYYRIET